MQELYELTTAWLIYLCEHMVLSRPSVEKIKGFTNPRLGHFPSLFLGLRAALQLYLGHDANSVSWLCFSILLHHPCSLYAP